MHLKKLPIGIQTFSRIIEDNYLYIDKTKDALEVVEDSTYIFLSRPRRFGKSLFLDTLRCIYEAREELFEGLYIKDKYDWSKKYPVIKLMLNDEFSMLNVNEIENIIINKLLNIAKEHDVIIEKSLVSIMFSELLRNIYNKYNKSVVILIDDWDKPLRDNLMTKNAKEINRLLWGIYINTKSDDAYIKFAFATGEIPIVPLCLKGLIILQIFRYTKDMGIFVDILKKISKLQSYHILMELI